MPVKLYPVNVDLLHVGDHVFLGSRKMNVAGVNRDGRRVLVTGRKRRKNCEIRWIDEKFLGTRPRNLVRRKIKSVHSVDPDVIDGLLDWVPTSKPTPTESTPGSREKIEILRRRVERGETLWHHEDRTQDNTMAGMLLGLTSLGLVDQQAAKSAQRATAQWSGSMFRYGEPKRGLIGSLAFDNLSQEQKEDLIKRQFKWEG
jgi:hypothetical protein